MRLAPRIVLPLVLDGAAAAHLGAEEVGLALAGAEEPELEAAHNLGHNVAAAADLEPVVQWRAVADAHVRRSLQASGEIWPHGRRLRLGFLSAPSRAVGHDRRHELLVVVVDGHDSDIVPGPRLEAFQMSVVSLKCNIRTHELKVTPPVYQIRTLVKSVLRCTWGLNLSMSS